MSSLLTIGLLAGGANLLLTLYTVGYKKLGWFKPPPLLPGEIESKERKSPSLTPSTWQQFWTRRQLSAWDIRNDRTAVRWDSKRNIRCYISGNTWTAYNAADQRINEYRTSTCTSQEEGMRLADECLRKAEPWLYE